MLLPPLRERPLDYQSKDAKYVFDTLNADESCSLVALGSQGKSNLLQFLTQDTARAHYLRPEFASHCLMALIDPHQMVCLSGQAADQAGSHWTGYEAMLNRLKYSVMGLYNSDRLGPKTESDRDALSALFDEMEEFHRLILKPLPLSLQIGLRHVEDALYKILSQGKTWRVVFLFDEVEELFALLPPEFFQSLRGLRDDFKDRMMYVTASRHTLDKLADEVAKSRNDPHAKMVLEGFYELFHEHTWYISPLDYRSFKKTMDGYFDKFKDSLPSIDERIKENLVHDLFDITGGHAGLARRSFLRAVEFVTRPLPEMNLGKYLLFDEAVRKECETIVGSLTPAEALAIDILAQGKLPTDTDVIYSLYDKHLVSINENSEPVLCLGILRDFVLRYPQATRRVLAPPL
jgi:hypothetical protein